MCKNVANMVQTWCKRAVTLRLNTAVRLPRYRGIHTRTDARVSKPFYLLNFLLTQTFLPFDSLARLLITSLATFQPCAKLTVSNLAACNSTTNRDPQHSVCKKDTSAFRARYQHLRLRKSKTSTSIANSNFDIDCHSYSSIATSPYTFHTSLSRTSTTTSHASTLPFLTSKQHIIHHPAADIP
jgi:hypothetical protein